MSDRPETPDSAPSGDDTSKNASQKAGGKRKRVQEIDDDEDVQEARHARVSLRGKFSACR